MSAAELIRDEEKLKRRYLKASKLLLLLAIIYSLWIALLIMGVYFLELGSRWAVLTIDQWLISAILLLVFILILEVFFVLHSTISRRKHIQRKKPQPFVMKGKHVHSYTLPVGAKGGIFSKTYIMIDDIKVLNLRYQMIPPNELWGKKQ